MSIFGRKHRLQEKVLAAKAETAMARQRLADAEEHVVIPHVILRKNNHFTDMIMASLTRRGNG